MSLISDHTYRITINGTKIKISLGSCSVQEFNTEEEFMMWVLKELHEVTARELDWFKEKYGTGG